MAITSGYFNSVNGDRKYNADQMSEYFEGIINEGVCQHIGGGLAVTAGTGLTVSVATGKAFIGQKWIKNDAAMTLTITTAADQARIDAVVLRRNTTNRVCEIAVKTGTPSASPSAPAMTRTSTTYEMALAYVNVAAGATSVTVTDKRADTTVCGWATVAQATSGEVDQMLQDMKTGFDGVVYPSPEAMVQGCDQILQNEINSIEVVGWHYGFINTYGNVDGTSYTDRQYSDFLLCPENTNITYIGETAHSSVLGISFYNKDKTFISGVANNGTNGEPQTVTSPAKTRYCRISTRSTYVQTSYYLPSTQTLDFVTKFAYANKAELNNRTDGHIQFTATSATRASANSLDGLLYAKVVDDNYDIALYYLTAGGSATNTGWVKSVKLCNYKQPYMLEIRKSDNSALSMDAVNEATAGTYMSWIATNGYVYKSNGVAYVDGTDGSDTNDGLNATTAFKTIQKAIDGGFKNILVKAGTYTEGINLKNENGIHIMQNKQYNSFDPSTANTNPKIIIDCDGTIENGVKLTNCSNCVFEDIEVVNAKYAGFNFAYCENLKLIGCIAHDCPGGNGFSFVHSYADVQNCGCYNIGTMGGGQHHDGFNISNTGTVNFINCWANYCEDDGLSHHDACDGYVDGGEWHHCGKAGIATPTHGAKVNVQNVYTHDSLYGIYAGNDTASLAKSFNITNCVCLNNTTKDIYVSNNTANIWNCIYDTIQHEGSGTNNVLSAT